MHLDDENRKFLKELQLIKVKNGNTTTSAKNQLTLTDDEKS